MYSSNFDFSSFYLQYLLKLLTFGSYFFIRIRHIWFVVQYRYYYVSAVDGASVLCELCDLFSLCCVTCNNAIVVKLMGRFWSLDNKYSSHRIH